MSGAVTIDANLLLLLIVGSTSRSYINKHKRLKNDYTVEDFDLLVKTLGDYDDVILLPNTLTEASNLLRYIDDPAKSEISSTMRAFIFTFTERFVPSNVAVCRQEFIKLGLADAALLEISRAATFGPAPTLLTVDLDLAIAAEMSGYRVSNFNHYRSFE